MLVLGIETSTDLSSVAFGTNERLIATMSAARGRGHVEFLMPAIEESAARAGHAVRDVTGVAVGLGPGLFTGMRVGIATAKTIAQMLHVPIVGVSSLDLLAYAVRHTDRSICACLDAKRNEVFAAFYRAVPGGIAREDEYRSLTADALAAEIVARGDDVLVVGTGATAYADTFGSAGAQVAFGDVRYPRASALIELAVPRFELEEFTAVERLEPLYVRRSDAEIKWEERGVTIERPNRVRIPSGGAR